MSIWPTKKLGEICRIRTGKKDVDEGNPQGEYPFFTCSREIAHSDTYSFDTEAILVAGNGDVGAIKYYKGKFEAYQRTYVLDQFKESIRFIYYFILFGLKRKLLQDKSGSTMPYVRKGDLESFEISFPEDSTEQKKIVYILDSIQEAVRVQDKIIEKTKELKKAMMNEIFNSKLQFKIQNWVKLGDHCEKPEYGYTASAIDKPVGPKFLRITDIQEDKVNWKSVPFCKGEQKDKYLLKKGDILVARIGATTGKTFIVKDPPEAIFASYLIRIKPKPELRSDFLNYYFQSDNYWSQIQRLKGGRLKGGINVPILQNLQIPFPSLSEQRKVVKIFQTLDQKIEIEQKKKRLYEELFKSMLNKLMTGEIRINNIN